MTTKIFFGGIILLIIIAGLIVYTNNQEDKLTTKMGEQVSFVCEDQNDFIAEFSHDMSILNVVIEKEVRYTLPNIGNEAVPHRFGDSEREYTFTGEEAIVTNLDTGDGTVCTQPLDPNNVPYNFGDNGGAEQEEAIEAISESIRGTWKSLDDEKFSRTFLDDGTVIDRYEGGEETDGTWTIFTKNSGITTTFTLQPEVMYLRLIMGEDTMYFSLSKLTTEELELTHLERGNLLRFTSVE